MARTAAAPWAQASRMDACFFNSGRGSGGGAALWQTGVIGGICVQNSDFLRGKVLRAGKAAKVAKGDRQTVVSAMLCTVEELALKCKVRGRLINMSKIREGIKKESCC